MVVHKGYGDTNAQAKVCQDIILKAISNSSLSRNVTIKGGVVMRSKTGNIRCRSANYLLRDIQIKCSENEAA